MLAGFGLAALSLRAQGAPMPPISWDDNSTNETGFAIERAPAAPSTAFVEIARVAANVTTYTDTNLPYKTTFQWRVRAFNADTTSAYSNIVSWTTPPAPINAPSNLRVPVLVTLGSNSKLVIFSGSLAYNGANKITVSYAELLHVDPGQQVLVQSL